MRTIYFYFTHPENGNEIYPVRNRHGRPGHGEFHDRDDFVRFGPV